MFGNLWTVSQMMFCWFDLSVIFSRYFAVEREAAGMRVSTSKSDLVQFLVLWQKTVDFYLWVGEEPQTRTIKILFTTDVAELLIYCSINIPAVNYDRDQNCPGFKWLK